MSESPQKQDRSRLPPHETHIWRASVAWPPLRMTYLYRVCPASSEPERSSGPGTLSEPERETSWQIANWRKR